MDSTTHWDYDSFFEQIDNATSYFNGGVRLVAEGPWSNSYPYDGSISGTYIETNSGDAVFSSTSSLVESQAKGTYSNWADVGEEYPICP